MNMQETAAPLQCFLALRKLHFHLFLLRDVMQEHQHCRIAGDRIL